jgi:hypothetical protein
MPAHPITDSGSSSLPTPAVHEPGITKSPVDKDGNPTSDPNERWYDPDTGRLMQKGISQALRENELLRTPSAIEGEGGAISEKQSRERGRMLQVRDQMAQLAAENGLKVPDSIAESLMPTPTAQAAKHGSTPDHGSNTPLGANLWDLPHVLPTPTTQDGKNNAGPSQFHRNTKPLNVEATLLGTPRTSAAHTPTPKQVEAGAPKQRLEDQVASAEQQIINWGRFEQAISRWEQTIGRQAPPPTKGDGKDGAHRLSSAFTEWMMGLPEGWITEVGLSRNDELKACGNGVVPQQAEMALRILLQGGGGATIENRNPATHTDSRRHLHGQDGKHTTERRVNALGDIATGSQDDTQ